MSECSRRPTAVGWPPTAVIQAPTAVGWSVECQPRAVQCHPPAAGSPDPATDALQPYQILQDSPALSSPTAGPSSRTHGARGTWCCIWWLCIWWVCMWECWWGGWTEWLMLWWWCCWWVGWGWLCWCTTPWLVGACVVWGTWGAWECGSWYGYIGICAEAAREGPGRAQAPTGAQGLQAARTMRRLPLPSRGPPMGTNCYITPAFSGIPNTGDVNRSGYLTLDFSGPTRGRIPLAG